MLATPTNENGIRNHTESTPTFAMVGIPSSSLSLFCVHTYTFVVAVLFCWHVFDVEKVIKRHKTMRDVRSRSCIAYKCFTEKLPSFSLCHDLSIILCVTRTNSQVFPCNPGEDESVYTSLVQKGSRSAETSHKIRFFVVRPNPIRWTPQCKPPPIYESTMSAKSLGVGSVTPTNKICVCSVRPNPMA